MKIKTLRADSSGNITMFVLSPVPKEKYAYASKRIMELRGDVEQVAFRSGENRIEMAGGEFCGNASRAFGMLLAVERGLAGVNTIDIEISGCDSPVSVMVDMENSIAEARMPLPLWVREKSVEGVRGTLVYLGGIAHFVVKGIEPDRVFFDRVENIFSDFHTPEAYGVIFLDASGNKMTPLIKVPAAGSLVWEGSCGSGSLACAVAESIGTEGAFSETYIQPAGRIKAGVVRQGGRLTAASIGGSVSLGGYEEMRL